MEYDITAITDSVIQIRMDIIKNCPTNCFIISGINRNYVIDTGFGSDTADIIKKQITNDKEIVVINTHYHWDHIWGNCGFKESFIISHMKCPEMIIQDWNKKVEKYAYCKRGEVTILLPNILIDKEMVFVDDGVRLFNTIGHTLDGICIFFEKEKILFVGDNIGDNEKEIIPSLECEKQKYKEELYNYKKINPDIILSGHNLPLASDFLDEIINAL